MSANDSGQRSEAPTPKRRQEARRRGQIPRSADLVSWVTLGIASFVVPTFIGVVYRRLADYFFIAAQASAVGDHQAALEAARNLTIAVGAMLGIFLAAVAVVAAAGMAVQGGVTLTLQPMKPKWERISIVAGFKRLFGPQSLVDTTKASIRLVVLAALVFFVGVSVVANQLGTTPRPLGSAGQLLAGSLLLVVRLAAVAGIVVGLADYAFQRQRVGRQLKMTKYEVKQENKNTEGDPVIRGRRRSLHARVSRNQMLAAVGDAAVVVVNPTHLAVALAYRGDGVPEVVAKGADDLALRIRERALTAGVPVVESRPLARLLHDHLDIGAEVPPMLYEAVAIVIAFVMRRSATRLPGVVDRLQLPAGTLHRTMVAVNAAEAEAARTERAPTTATDDGGGGVGDGARVG